MSPAPENPRYRRQVRAEGFGPEAQARLARARVGIVGLGALGSRVAEDLARSGFGFLRLIDRDWVELSNLHRQHLYDERDAEAEEPKSLAAAQRIAEINSEVRLDPELRDLGPEDVEELLGDLDLWIDGTDNFQTRYVLNDFAVRAGRPWIYGACVANQAMVAHFVPGSSCMRCLVPEPPPAESTQTCETSGIIPPAAAFVAGLQSAIAMRLVGRPDDVLEPRLFTADLRTMKIRDMKLPGVPVAGCESCEAKSYPALRLVPTSRAKRLCGRNAVQ
ncbi:MAG: ThiF family adenylyltransferase, partial [Planctomycetota bacterium]